MLTIHMPIIMYANYLLCAAAEKISPYHTMAVHWWESGFKWDAIGDDGHSFGLGQLNDQGAGAGHSPEYLLDISNNIRLSTEFLAMQIDRSPGDLALGFARYRHPALESLAEGDDVDRRYAAGVMANYQELIGATIAVIPDIGGQWSVTIDRG